jgi:AcrR family transcriptional regulator
MASARTKAKTPSNLDAPRRGRPPTVCNEALLDAAREVFLERGIRATSLEVAERAGVSEGALFHRFGSKDALFRAAMRFDPREQPEALKKLSQLAGIGDLRANLTSVGSELLEVGQVALPVMMMSWSNPTGEYGLANLSQRRADGYQKAFQSVCDFFEVEIRTGRLSGCQAEALTRIFIGSLHHYCFSELLLVGGQGMRMGPQAFVRALVDALLKAGNYQESEPAPSPRNRKLRRV